MNLENLKKAQRIYFNLLKDGSTSDKEFLDDYESNEEVPSLLDILAQESNSNIFKIRGTIYLIPNMDNKIFNYNYRNDSRFPKKDDFYMAQYIMTIIFSEFTNEIKEIEFITIDSLINLISENLEIAKRKANIDELELESSFNIKSLDDYWSSKLVSPDSEDKSLKTTSLTYKIGIVRRTLSLLINSNLIDVIDDVEIRPTKKFKDLMGFILDIDRKSMIEDIFKE